MPVTPSWRECLTEVITYEILDISIALGMMGSEYTTREVGIPR